MNIQKLNQVFKEADGVLITSAHNLRYFTGFCGGEGSALISQNHRFLFVDSRYTIAAQNEAPGFEVVEFKGGKLIDEINNRLDSIHTLAFEDAYMSVAEYNSITAGLTRVKLIGASSHIEAARMIKTSEELEYLRKAEQIGTDAFNAVLSMIKVGIKETDIASELEYQMRKLGADGTSFETIAVSGIKSGMPHGKPDEKLIEYGDLLTMDFGCRYKGYCSDMTRTVVIGKASEKQREIYSVVLEAQLAGLEAIRPGICGRDADKAARDIIDQNGYGANFGHSLGHGVGLLIHEQPNLSPRSETILQPGMVVTCEPGIYIPDFGGIRIEDMVCVTETGIENFTHCPKELIEI